jgi:hypothetical protein
MASAGKTANVLGLRGPPRSCVNLNTIMGDYQINFICEDNAATGDSDRRPPARDYPL